MYDIIVVGAGPSGLSAAITASYKRPELNILILEKENKCGRKLSASGNGKCNVSNNVFDRKCYHSYDVDFIEKFISQHSLNEIKMFFEKIGILLYEKNGYYYPVSNQAKQITELMIEQCRGNGIEILTDSCVTSIRYSEKDRSYEISTSHCSYFSRRIIIASGSNAYPKISGSDSGYNLVKDLGIGMTDIYPGLSPVWVDDKNIRIAKGVRIDGTVTLKSNKFSFKEAGQIQYNEDNLSGIALMNLSCYIPYMSKEECSDSIYIDAMPYMSWDRLKEFFLEQKICNGQRTLFYVLEGLFPNGFVQYLTTRLHINADYTINSLSEKQINRLTSNIKKLTYTPKLQTDYNKAQVTLGGVEMSEINNTTFESKRYKGLYLIGELLDMTGKCGGYNITFALLSGISAGNSIAKGK